MNDKSETHKQLTFEAAYDSPRVGVFRTKVTVFFNGKKETHYPKVTFLPTEAPQEYTYEIINTYSHDTNDYTQGLLIDNGFLFESSGRKGRSTLEKKNIKTGETLAQFNLPNEFFGEGLALLNDQFYQLTYTSGACFVYNKAFEKENTFSYEGEGWGLCTYEGKLLMTNGSEKILVRNPETFSVVDELQVYDTNGKVTYLNELEIIDGLIYVNVYQKNYILVVDPNSGAVLRKINLEGLLEEVKGGKIDVLNGIAYDPENDKTFVTGKLWPKLFELKFKPKNES
ncbi:MAG: glutaminyl-peptide cyclotransferase [Bacteroidota bacterium]